MNFDKPPIGTREAHASAVKWESQCRGTTPPDDAEIARQFENRRAEERRTAGYLFRAGRGDDSDRVDQPDPKPVARRKAATRAPDGVTTSPVVVVVGDVEPERVEWLWPGRIPFGKVGMFDGDPGLGKSTLLLDLAARTSTASPFPDGYRPTEIRSVLVLSAEDGLADTIRPRLEAAGADLSRVRVIEAIAVTSTDEDGSTRPAGCRPLVIPDDLDHVERVIRDHRVGLVIVDPLMAYLNGGVDAHRDQDVRRAMHPLTTLAQSTGAAIVCCRHLNKAGGSNAIYRGGGSIGIIGAARVGMLVAADPEDDSRRVLAVAKSNLAAIPTALAYRLVADELRDVARITWHGPTGHRAGDLLEAPRQEARDEAVDFLTELLVNGPVPSKQVKAEASDAGLSWATVRRAQEHLGITPRKLGAPGEDAQRWVWQLPAGPEGAHENPEGAHENPEDVEDAHVLSGEHLAQVAQLSEHEQLQHLRLDDEQLRDEGLEEAW